MGKFITDERTGLKYELVEGVYLIAGEDAPLRPIGIWGQRHLKFIKEHKRLFYTDLLTSGKLNDYLADVNEQSEEMFSRLVKILAEKEGVTEIVYPNHYCHQSLFFFPQIPQYTYEIYYHCLYRNILHLIFLRYFLS